MREEKAREEASLRAVSTNGYARVLDRVKGKAKAKAGVQGGPLDLIGVVV